VSQDNFVFRRKKAPQRSLCISPTYITIFTVKPNQFSTTLAEINFFIWHRPLSIGQTYQLEMAMLRISFNNYKNIFKFGASIMTIG